MADNNDDTAPRTTDNVTMDNGPDIEVQNSMHAEASNTTDPATSSITDQVTSHSTDPATNNSTDQATTTSNNTDAAPRLTHDGAEDIHAPPSKRPKILDFSDANLCRIIVGKEDDQKEFVDNADFLMRRSVFFKTALSDRWKTPDDKTVRLPDECAGVFGAYLH
ncbi:hypothetical protein M011DRAFT_473458 [Sporormia fimetaria CBS 119925]|uniref:BTB domain-containing protein n=1 Tax=Sporormia fimetaria CBS 119925 TaxID=1340428 RepID=A0A6A6VQP8_9PLEO|nr:hypothetical protein M011DRAFT_473458 [Sporormia fimetaria CBS 119925]